jgi:hypothetical protein
MFVTGPILGAVRRDTITAKVIEYCKAESNLETISGPLGTQYRITLTRLDPGTTYYYRFGLRTNAGTTWSLPSQWTTDGGAGPSFRFAVWADSGPLLGSAMPLAFKQMLDVLAQHTPLALGIAGAIMSK